MIKLDIKSELPKGVKFTNEMVKQLPFSVATSINAAVQGSQFLPGSKQKSALRALAGSSLRYLDRPKKQTQTGFRATRATKRNLFTVIQPKDLPFDRNRYLSGNILGGTRAPKDFGAALMRHPKAKNIPPNARLVPTRYWEGEGKLDRYGNISRTNIKNLFKNVGNSNRSGGNIFIGKPKGGARPPGVYRRERDAVLRPLFYAVTSVSYSPRFPATQIVEDAVQKTFGLYLRYELTKNVSKEIKRGSADLRTGLLW